MNIQNNQLSTEISAAERHKILVEWKTHGAICVLFFLPIYSKFYI